MATKIEKTLLSGLNPRQIEAVCNTGGHTLVFAGAGSGKTRVLTTRIAFLVLETGTPPEDILAVTFTNKAAREMRERVEAVLPGGIGGIWLGTFHSICARILRADIERLEAGYGRNFVIYDTGDQKAVIKKILAEIGVDEKKISPEGIKSRIEIFKRNNNFPPSQESFFPNERNVFTKMEVMERYITALKKSNALDFNDLLLLTDRLLNTDRSVLEKYRNRFKHILVDEYQDTNRMQYNFVKMLGEDNAEVFVVGDDSQSIYAWRGAELENILRFSEDFQDTKVVRLTQNYRSTANILKASNALISNNRIGEKKEMWTNGEEGEKIEVYEARNEFDEADFAVSKIKSFVEAGDFVPGDFAVLYRTNSKSRLIEERFFKEDGITCVVVGALSFYARAEIKDLISYMRLLSNPSDNAAILRIINTPPRGIGGATVDKLSEFASLNKVSIMEAVRRAPSEGFLDTRATKAVDKFALIVENLSNLAQGKGAFEVLNLIIAKTGYSELLEKDEDRRDNVREFVSSASEFDKNHWLKAGEDFKDFVEQVALASDSDTETGNDSVKLMTLHASKGLEFSVVFIVGMNEGLIPLCRDDDLDPKEERRRLEEERRLFYVGMTRAKERLFLCYPLQRNFYGKIETVYPSPFFDEIPEDLKHSEYLVPTNFSCSTDEHVHNAIMEGVFVRHEKFGRGKVVRVEGSGTKAAVTVIFPKSGRKRILASFLTIV